MTDFAAEGRLDDPTSNTEGRLDDPTTDTEPTCESSASAPDETATTADEATDENTTTTKKAPLTLAALLEQEGEIAADYLEGLLDIADLDGDLDMDVEGERAIVSVVGASLNQLVGAKGEVLESLQELTRLAVHRQTGERSRLMLDISNWRANRREELMLLGQRTAETVRESGEAVKLEPMTPFERKAVHDAVTEIDGVRSESEGEEPRRYIVVHPDKG
ncbi:MAG: spoIIIJ-associated protein [Frankiales bacterium]|nr:spoIIIJ-associated protein [Frankiales bacterium]